MSKLTEQQILVRDNLIGINNSIHSFNENIRKRATLVAGASTTIVGIITTANFIPSSFSIENISSIFLAISCLFSLMIYWYSAKLWASGVTSFGGCTDRKKLYERYISQTLDIAFDNQITDLCGAIEQNREDNAIKRKAIDWCVYYFMLQIFVLILAIAVPVFTSA